MKTLQASGFLLGALIVGWLGAYADTFVFPMDRTTSRALGSPTFAYGPILLSHALFASAGALVFAVSNLFLGAGAPGLRRALAKGAFTVPCTRHCS
jgi:hypothetical protein